MKTPSMGLLLNMAGHNNFTEPKAVGNLIKYIFRENKNPSSDLIAKGGVGVIEFCGTENIISQFLAIQEIHTRKGDFGRYIYHEIFSFSPDTAQYISAQHPDMDAIAREMAYDFYERDRCQVIYGVHDLSGDPPDRNIHIHFAINAVNYINGKKRRENKRETEEREARFNKIVADAFGGTK